MNHFLALIALMACTIPALLSVAFASRRWYVMLWNFGWYWIMAQLGQNVTGTPAGGGVGFFFAILYVWRVTSRRNHGESRFVVRNFTNKQNPFTSERAEALDPEAVARPSPMSRGQGTVIDAEFRHTDADPFT